MYNIYTHKTHKMHPTNTRIWKPIIGSTFNNTALWPFLPSSQNLRTCNPKTMVSYPKLVLIGTYAFDEIQIYSNIRCTIKFKLPSFISSDIVLGHFWWHKTEILWTEPRQIDVWSVKRLYQEDIRFYPYHAHMPGSRIVAWCSGY